MCLFDTTVVSMHPNGRIVLRREAYGCQQFYVIAKTAVNLVTIRKCSEFFFGAVVQVHEIKNDLECYMNNDFEPTFAGLVYQYSFDDVPKNFLAAAGLAEPRQLIVSLVKSETGYVEVVSEAQTDQHYAVARKGEDLRGCAFAIGYPIVLDVFFKLVTRGSNLWLVEDLETKREFILHMENFHLKEAPEPKQPIQIVTYYDLGKLTKEQQDMLDNRASTTREKPTLESEKKVYQLCQSSSDLCVDIWRNVLSRLTFRDLLNFMLVGNDQYRIGCKLLARPCVNTFIIRCTEQRYTIQIDDGAKTEKLLYNEDEITYFIQQLGHVRYFHFTGENATVLQTLSNSPNYHQKRLGILEIENSHLITIPPNHLGRILDIASCVNVSEVNVEDTKHVFNSVLLKIRQFTETRINLDNCSASLNELLDVILKLRNCEGKVRINIEGVRNCPKLIPQTEHWLIDETVNQKNIKTVMMRREFTHGIITIYYEFRWNPMTVSGRPSTSNTTKGATDKIEDEPESSCGKKKEVSRWSSGRLHKKERKRSESSSG